MSISRKRIAEIASMPGVDRVAVENFLGTLDGLTSIEALNNLRLDIVSYKWSVQTGRAIQQGIMEAFRG